MAQVEALRMLLRSGQEALEPPSKVGSLADVGLGVGILAAQKKHRRGSGYVGEDLGVSFRAELDAFGQHSTIVEEVKGQRSDCRGEARGAALNLRNLTFDL